MQTCSKCHYISPDSEQFCQNCGADLSQFSVRNQDLKKLQSNPRVTAVRVSVSKDSCPTCRQYEGVYSKADVPALPIAGCSHPGGCRCQYAPILDEIFP